MEMLFADGFFFRISLVHVFNSISFLSPATHPPKGMAFDISIYHLGIRRMKVYACYGLLSYVEVCGGSNYVYFKWYSCQKVDQHGETDSVGVCRLVDPKRFHAIQKSFFCVRLLRPGQGQAKNTQPMQEACCAGPSPGQGKSRAQEDARSLSLRGSP